MKDKHGLDHKTAEKDCARKQLEKWVKGKKGSRAAARRKAAAAAAGEANVSDVATQVLANDDDASMEEDEGAGLNRMYINKCDLCGVESQMSVNLSASGLGFTCAYLGQPCRSSSSTAPAAAQGTGLSVPSNQVQMSFPNFGGAQPPTAPVPSSSSLQPFQVDFQSAAHRAQFEAAMQVPLPDDDDDDDL
eukprot:CAMPEP_0206422036 /NCGR_PEP_ID=MMETSP0324_2-20121206/1826_1 /ASSEMBLY_ACC=CAM_ASM_000836 /TAXON_ID=2866 /ORGANISM="Crypthecodinium cohnii, Strain Seligo" /LENGTH=189 /DNA_ID=CAMNT_0053886289 /DNA_START=132 /DNA_END=701 /DNA_ORIENTATION=-